MSRRHSQARPSAVRLACTGALLFVGTLGCPSAGKIDTRVEARHARPDAGFDAGTALIDPASGAPVLLTGDRLPDTFPRSVVLYPGAKVLGVVVTTDAGKRTHVVTLSTADSPAMVDDFYRTHTHGMITSGEHETSLAHDRTLDAVDAAVALRLTVNAARSGLGTTVQLTTVEG